MTFIRRDMNGSAKIVGKLVDVCMDGEGYTHLILDIRNKEYARALIKLLRGYKEEDVRIYIRF